MEEGLEENGHSLSRPNQILQLFLYGSPKAYDSMAQLQGKVEQTRLALEVETPKGEHLLLQGGRPTASIVYELLYRLCERMAEVEEETGLRLTDEQVRKRLASKVKHMMVANTSCVGLF